MAGSVLYRIPFNTESSVYIDGLPEPERFFSYKLERCRGKDHSTCGETFLEKNGRLLPFKAAPVGARCGLLAGDRVIEWKYTRVPLSETPYTAPDNFMDIDEKEDSSGNDKSPLVWKKYMEGSLPQANRPFLYTLHECGDFHNTCGIAERAADEEVRVAIPACSSPCPSVVDPTMTESIFDSWSYLNP
jgi:hypothetical protein